MDILDKVSEVLAQSEKPIMIELGGCDGYHSNIILSHLTQMTKDFTYIVLEPVPRLAKQIQAVLSWCPNVQVFQKAIGSSNGVVPFYESDTKYYGSSSIRKPTEKNFEFWSDMKFQESTCETITLDTLIENCGLTNKTIDLIWADVQGAEEDLILGGKQTLKNTMFFYTEFVAHEIYEGQIHEFDKICSMLPNFDVEHKFDYDILFKNKNIEYNVTKSSQKIDMQPKPPTNHGGDNIYRPAWR
jgi:FkbM family methyltransferase